MVLTFGFLSLAHTAGFYTSPPLFHLGGSPFTEVTLALLVPWLVVVGVGSGIVGGRAGSRLDPGLRYAPGRLTRYAILVIGLLLALQNVGIQMSSLTVLVGAVGVGIGFGLQRIVNNIVSGLIVLLERPVRVGDWIEVDGRGGRATRTGRIHTPGQTNLLPHVGIISRHLAPGLSIPGRRSRNRFARPWRRGRWGGPWWTRTSAS